MAIDQETHQIQSRMLWAITLFWGGIASLPLIFFAVGILIEEDIAGPLIAGMSYGALVLLWPIILFLRRRAFTYSFDNEFLNLKQGILRREERHIPYAVMQHVSINRRLLGWLFDYAHITIENAALGGAVAPQTRPLFSSRRFSREQELQERAKAFIGFRGNTVSIPGLALRDAEEIKQFVMKKMKENPQATTAAGL